MEKPRTLDLLIAGLAVEREINIAYEELLLSEMTEAQCARVWERWELICQQRGWRVDD